VFTARYALSPYIKQTSFVFKGLKHEWMECKYFLHMLFLLISELSMWEGSGAELVEHRGMKLCICTFIELIKQSFMYNNNKITKLYICVCLQDINAQYDHPWTYNMVWNVVNTTKINFTKYPTFWKHATSRTTCINNILLKTVRTWCYLIHLLYIFYIQLIKSLFQIVFK
jgi:hypothetical protein